MEKIKVLHLTPPDSHGGGIGSYIFGHYRYMDQERFQFDFLTRDKGLKNAEEYSEFSYRVHLLPCTAGENRELFISQIGQILDEGYDILHLHTSFWTGFLLEEIAMKKGIRKVIVHAHSSFVEEADGEKRELLLKHHVQLKEEFSEKYATDLCACSKLAADWLFGPQIPRSKIRIMKNAIETEKYRFNQKMREQVREKLGLDGKIVLGTTGRISYAKNHEFLIELFSVVRKERQDVCLLIVGSGNLELELKWMIGRYHLEDSVILTGWKADIGNYLSAMDIFLLPSRFEGFPIGLLEAVASGLPCLASDHITQEIEFSTQIQRLECSVEKWNMKLQKMMYNGLERYEGSGILKEAGFDVREQAKVLERFYKE